MWAEIYKNEMNSAFHQNDTLAYNITYGIFDVSVRDAYMEYPNLTHELEQQYNITYVIPTTIYQYKINYICIPD
jgi:hypothetical protein